MRALLHVLCVLALSVALHPVVAQQTRVTDTKSSLVCIQNTLGGTGTFATVSSLYIKSETKPLRTSGGPIPGTREISIVFPDRYFRADRGQPFRPGEPELSSFIGFDRDAILSSPKPPDKKRAQASAHQYFAREVLMRLPRTLEGVNLAQATITDSGRERLAITASGSDDLKATLIVDRSTCVPVALQFDTVRGFVSGLARIDLSQYRSFGGIRFPTLLRMSIAGQPHQEEQVTSIEVNSPTALKVFLGRR